MGRQNPTERNRFYRLSFTEDDTHMHLWSLKFRRSTLALAIAAGTMLLIALSYSIIAFTPLRTIIPGYPDSKSKKAAITNAIKIDSLENAILRWNIYAENLSRVLSGEDTGRLDSLLKAGAAQFISDKPREELAMQDSILRESIRKEEQFKINGKEDRKLPLEGRHFFTPVKGVVSQGFDRTIHPAIDISAPSGSVVSAIYDGTVIFAGWNEASGNVIIIQHEGDLLSIYQHNERLLKREGETVKAGESIALLGSSKSISKNDHLRLEMWHNGTPVDPTTYISF